MAPAPALLPGVVEILMVEDDPLDGELTLRALRRHNMADRLVWVRDGAEALAVLFGASGDPAAPLCHAPKLVLLDLKLPKVDGHELLRRLKSDPRTRAIPVVVLTSSCEEMDLVQAYESGGNSFVVKPVDFESFVDTVRQVMLLLAPAESGARARALAGRAWVAAPAGRPGRSRFFRNAGTRRDTVDRCRG